MKKIIIDGCEVTARNGETYQVIAERLKENYMHRALLAKEGQILKELSKIPSDGVSAEFLTIEDKIGYQTYQRSVVFLLCKAVHEICADEDTRVKVEFAAQKGVFVNVETKCPVDDAFAKAVEEKMKEYVAASIPFIKETISRDKAIRLFGEKGMKDKAHLFTYRRTSFVNVYSVGDYCDYSYGYMVPNTEYLEKFGVVSYNGGLVLMIPERTNPDEVPAFISEDKIFACQLESAKWGKTMNIESIAHLNDAVVKGKVQELILVQEALMEQKIGEIARMIAADPQKKFVMIAGPSSSGKTSFSHRLSIQLRTLGLTPHPIATDNYFVDREKTPRDENGDYNYECLEAIDVEQFNEDMKNLISGKEVPMPTFNFKQGKREYKGDTLKLGADDILVIEGIHGLNDKLSYALAAENKFKIYISALTQLNIDDHNRITSTDGRLIRRMVRDSRTRGTQAQTTMSMWPSVNRGEHNYIFPYQESADVVFNSALIYELAVLKAYAEPLLYRVPQDAPEFPEAKRLLKFFDYFLSISTDDIPKNSLLREFVGGSVFNVG